MLDSRSLLTQVGLTEAEIDVYLAMLSGAGTARKVIEATGRSRPTVYYAMSSLERRGLLSKTGLPEEKRYRLEPLKRLKTVLDQQESQIEQARGQLEEFVRQHQPRSQADRKPQISFYEGVNAVRNVVMESLYSHKRHIDTLVPSDNFFWQLGPEFVEKYVEMRHALRISTRNLWGKSVEQSVIDAYYVNAEIRMLPDGLGDQFRTTIFMYDDCVLYISSLASGYCLLVKSAEHMEMMQMMYGVMWGRSKEVSK